MNAAIGLGFAEASAAAALAGLSARACPGGLALLSPRPDLPKDRRARFRLACAAHRALPAFLPFPDTEAGRTPDWVARNAAALRRALEAAAGRGELVVTLRASPSAPVPDGEPNRMSATVPTPAGAGAAWLRARAAARQAREARRLDCAARLEGCAVRAAALGAERMAIDLLEDGAEMVLLAVRADLPALLEQLPREALISGLWPPGLTAARLMEPLS